MVQRHHKACIIVRVVQDDFPTCIGCCVVCTLVDKGTGMQRYSKTCMTNVCIVDVLGCFIFMMFQSAF